MLALCVSQFGLVATGLPLVEMDRFASQRSLSRVRVRITEALTAAEPTFHGSYGVVGRRELEALCSLGHRMPAALVWVFS